MVKGAANHFYRNGLRAGYTDYRYGSKPKKRAPKPVFTPDRRKHVVHEVIDQMKQWRSSPFEFEGTVRASIRSALCLQGIGWHRSDNEAASVVSEALRIIGAQRPTWEQGQREYSIPEENCNWCGIPLPEGTRERFCDPVCAKAALSWRDYETRYKESLIGNSAYRVVARSRNPERPCKNCGEMFRPLQADSDQQFCSQRCFGAYRAYLPEKQCKQCGKSFRPRQAGNTSLFCSSACYHKHGRTEEYHRQCVWCFRPFVTKSARAIFCSGTCKTQMFRVTRGDFPKRLTPPVFDYVFKQAA